MKTHDGRLRVAAYCRVSTESEEQKNSFESQKRFFRETAEREPSYLLTKIYADAGSSGTSVKKRKEFLRMMASARAGEIDLILTKEISRFARNTLDSIRYTRELKALGVGVIFLADGIDTREGDAELRLAILSSIAQEESRRTSERVKWGQRRRMEAGVVFGRSMLGYDVQNGHMEIEAAGADIVQEIFRRFTEEKKGTHVIARELSDEGRIHPLVKAWTAVRILRILKNEKYCGDLVQKKTYTPDFLTHEKKYNHGEEALIVLRDHHAPIVSRDIFEKAQQILALRAEGQRGKEKYSEKHAFSGRVSCGVCGGKMTARKNGREDVIFRCRNASCRMTFGLREETALAIARRAFEKLSFSRESLFREVEARLFSESARDLTKWTVANRRLITLYAEGAITHEEFLEARRKYASVASADVEQANERASVEKKISAILSGGRDGSFFRLLGVSFSVYGKEDARLSFAALPFRFYFRIEGRGRGQEVIFLGAEKTLA